MAGRWEARLRTNSALTFGETLDKSLPCPESVSSTEKEDKRSLLRVSRSTRQRSGSQVLWEVQIEGRGVCH